MIEEKTIKLIAKNIVTKIIYDLSDRRGLDNEWDSIDDNIKEGIIEKWKSIIEKEISEGVL